MTKCGIYSIKNKVNGKVYIGSSVNIQKRWTDHKSFLNNNKHQNIHLQRSWNKYGENLFEFSIIKQCYEDNLLELEQQYLNSAKKEKTKHYNISYTAGGGDQNTKTISKKQKQELLKFWEKYGTMKLIEYSSKKYNIGINKTKKLAKEFRENTGKRSWGYNKDTSCYTFFNKNTGETFVGLRTQFKKQYEIPECTVSDIFRRGSSKGWTILKTV